MRKRISKEKRRVQFQRRMFMFTFLALPILSFLIFYVYANFNSIVMAFQRPGYEGQADRWSMENFIRVKELFTGDGAGGELLLALLNTLSLWAAGMLIGLPLWNTYVYCYYKYYSSKYN